MAQKGGPLLKMAMLEEDICVNKDEGEGPIGPRATSICKTADISPLSSVEVKSLNSGEPTLYIKLQK